MSTRSQNGNRGGPTWRWLVGVGVLALTALVGVVYNSKADQVDRNTNTIAGHTVDIALLKQQTKNDSVLSREFRENVKLQLDELNRKTDIILDCIGRVNCDTRQARRKIP